MKPSRMTKQAFIELLEAETDPRIIFKAFNTLANAPGITFNDIDEVMHHPLYQAITQKIMDKMRKGEK